MQFVGIFSITENKMESFSNWAYANKVLAEIEEKGEDEYDVNVYTSSLDKVSFKDNKVILFSEEYEEFIFNEGEFEEIEIG